MMNIVISFQCLLKEIISYKNERERHVLGRHVEIKVSISELIPRLVSDSAVMMLPNVNVVARSELPLRIQGHSMSCAG